MPSAAKSERSLAYKRDRRARYLLREGFLDEQRRRSLSEDIPADNPVGCQDEIAAGIREGRFKLMDILEDGQEVGWCVYAILPRGDLKEMVCISAFAQGRDNVAAGITPLLEEIAAANGCKCFRIHTMREGLIEKLIEQGWFVSEVVMRKEIS